MTDPNFLPPVLYHSLTVSTHLPDLSLRHPPIFVGQRVEVVQERQPLHQLHCNVQLAPSAEGLVVLHDVRVVQARQNLDFPCNPGPPKVDLIWLKLGKIFCNIGPWISHNSAVHQDNVFHGREKMYTPLFLWKSLRSWIPRRCPVTAGASFFEVCPGKSLFFVTTKVLASGEV